VSAGKACYLSTGWYTFDKYHIILSIYSLTDKVTAHAPRYSSLLIEGRHIWQGLEEEWIPRAIENVRKLWRKRYKDKVPIVHLWVESTKELEERDQSTISQIGDEFDSFIDGFAIDILSIPAMSAEPERVFSGCRRTITWQRMRLGVKVVEEGECLKSWIRSGIVAGIRLNSKV